ncbi:MAG: response regulator [Bdellovibrionales bacterium]|nr:response regulator [Bdellovibrionales bacterium]
MKAIRVLMIDDEPSVLFALKLLMEALGYEVTTADSGADGLEILSTATESFDYVLCDLKMPNLNGLEVLSRVREISPSTPFVLMSAHATQGEIQQAQALGISGFLGKPFTPDEIKKLIC